MSKDHDKKSLEQRLRQDAAGLRYPPTPDFSRRLERQASMGWLPRLVVGLAVVAIAALAVQPVRAGLLDFLRIGAVAIEQPQATQAATPAATVYLLDVLSNPTSLAAARAEAGFAIPLPSWPPEAGEPDAVYLQSLDASRQFAILVWTLDDSDAVDYALYVLGPGVELTKGAPVALRELEINGRPAAYVQGGHLLVVDGMHQSGVLVSGTALIWEGADGLTYRLESERSLEDVIRIAESIEKE
jgi:hypothetical protein